MHEVFETTAPTAAAGADAEESGFFDAPLLAELEDLARAAGARVAGEAGSGALPDKLAAFLRGPSEAAPLDEDAFTSLPATELTERTNALLEICRGSALHEPLQAVENFVVFFRALLPTLSEGGSDAVKRAFFRLAPNLIQIAYGDFSDQDDKRREGREALRSLEHVLLEIANVRLAPIEGELVLKSIDQMVALMSVAEYALASEMVSSQLLELIARNRLTRALYRLMEVEVGLQRYLKERRGYLTPRLRLPDDARVLADYGPVRVFEEAFLDGVRRRMIQVHVPNVPSLRDVVLHLVDEMTQRDYALRLDRLGSAELDVPDAFYSLGLSYEPRR